MACIFRTVQRSGGDGRKAVKSRSGRSILQPELRSSTTSIARALEHAELCSRSTSTDKELVFDLEEEISWQDMPGLRKSLEANSSAAELCRSYPTRESTCSTAPHIRHRISWLERGRGGSQTCMKDGSAREKELCENKSEDDYAEIHPIWKHLIEIDPF